MNHKKSNIVLIGMPGAGKSTIGVLLAKALGYGFCDTDIVIQNREAHTLQTIINEKGISCFLQREMEIILTLQLERHVIATGGSVVYYDSTMDHLKKDGMIVYLEVPYEELEKRITNIDTRGVAMGKRETLRDIYFERLPLYTKHAEYSIQCKNKHIEDIIRELIITI
jgi:shikimate kinase